MFKRFSSLSRFFFPKPHTRRRRHHCRLFGFFHKNSPCSFPTRYAANGKLNSNIHTTAYIGSSLMPLTVAHINGALERTTRGEAARSMRSMEKGGGMYLYALLCAAKGNVHLRSSCVDTRGFIQCFQIDSFNTRMFHFFF